MAYFDYHNKIKKLIKDGKLKSFFFEKAYKNIGFALVLCFDDKKYPIREERFAEYFELIGKHYAILQKDKECQTEYLF